MISSRWSSEDERLKKALSCLGFIRCPRYDNNPIICSYMRFMHYDFGTGNLIKENSEVNLKFILIGYLIKK